MWRTSPSLYWPVTVGSGPSRARASAAAISPTVRGVPDPTLNASTPVIEFSQALTVAAAMSLTWTKSRRWQPSSNTLGASPRRNAEVKMAATPA